MAALIVALLAFSAPPQQCPSSRLLPAYAHNDYQNPHPLQDALALGFQGVEADYVLVNGKLLVGHSRGDTRPGRTLERLYLSPLRERIRLCGWVQAAERRFLLTVEYKGRALEGYRALREELTRFRDVVGTARAPGRVEVVLVGWHPSLEEMAADSLQPATVQARITRSTLEVPKGDSTLVGLVSLDYGKTVDWRGRGSLPHADRSTLGRIQAARRLLPGRLIRAYDVPPVRAVYELLLQSGVDLIGTKDLEETRKILAPE